MHVLSNRRWHNPGTIGRASAGLPAYPFRNYACIWFREGLKWEQADFSEKTDMGTDNDGEIIYEG